MGDTQSVKRALARLARGEPVPDWYRDRVIDDATAAVTDVRAAASLVEEGGLGRLERAVDAAERAGETRLARRGQRALAAFEWVSRACTGINTGTDQPGRQERGPDERATRPTAGTGVPATETDESRTAVGVPDTEIDGSRTDVGVPDTETDESTTGGDRRSLGRAVERRDRSATDARHDDFHSGRTTPIGDRGERDGT